MADTVRQDDVVLARVQRLSRTEQFSCKRRCQHCAAAAGRSVKNQDWLPGLLADRRVMDLEFLHDFAGIETEVTRHPVSLFRRRISLCRSIDGCYERCHSKRSASEHSTCEHQNLLL